jgi:hypothetical protein
LTQGDPIQLFPSPTLILLLVVLLGAGIWAPTRSSLTIAPFRFTTSEPLAQAPNLVVVLGKVFLPLVHFITQYAIQHPRHSFPTGITVSKVSLLAPVD